MQVPLSYAEDIIGVGGSNIAYIRRTSGAILTIKESRVLPDEITVEIKGSTSQVQMAQQLIQVIVFNNEMAHFGYWLHSFSFFSFSCATVLVCGCLEMHV